MASIKRRTTLWVGIALSVLLGSTDIGVYLALHQQGLEDLDRLLRLYARSVAAQIESDSGRLRAPPQDRWTNQSQAFLPSFSYTIWAAGGKVVIHSGSLDGEIMRPISEVPYARPIFSNRHLPKGRKIRLAQMDLRSSYEEDGTQADAAGDGLPDWLRPQLTLIVAADWRTTESSLMRIQRTLAGTLLGSILIASLLVWYSIGKGLRPISKLGARLRSFTDKYGSRAPRITCEYDEICLIVEPFNHLVRQLDASRQRVDEMSRASVGEGPMPALEITSRPERVTGGSGGLKPPGEPLVSTVTAGSGLSYTGDARLDGPDPRAHSSLHMGEVVLHELIDQLFRGLISEATSVHKILVNRISTDLVVNCDRDLLGHMLSNLLDNAIKYSPPTARIVCASGRDEEQAWIAITNPAPNLEARGFLSLLDRNLEERRGAWSADDNGVGLSLVYIYADLMGLEVNVELTECGEVCVVGTGLRIAVTCSQQSDSI